MPTLNFSKVEETSGGFGPVPEGIYTVRVKSVNVDASSKGDEMWNLTLEIIDGPEGAPDQALAGRLIWDNVIWSRGGLPRVKLVFKALGLDVDSDDDVDWLPEMLTYRSAKIDVGVGEWNGKPRNKVGFGGWYALDRDVGGSSGSSVGSSSDAGNSAKQPSKPKGGSASVRSTQSVGSGKPSSQPPHDDDIPF